MTAVRFLLDEHIRSAVALGLRRAGHEALTVHEAGRRGASDRSHLEWALAEDWVVVTHDKGFLALARRVAVHSGLVFCAQDKYAVGGLVRALEQLALDETMESIRGRVHYL